MGDRFQTIVDRDASPDEAQRLGPAILEWLVAEGIVDVTPDADCVLGKSLGHLPGPQCAKALACPDDRRFLSLVTNGVTVVTGTGLMFGFRTCGRGSPAGLS
jgi:hypothetical protein